MSKLEEVREKQSNRLISLGFHKYLYSRGVTEKEFRDLVELPMAIEDPLLVVSEEAINLRVQMELIGSLNLFAIPHHVNLIRVPDLPLYWIYGVEDGRVLLNANSLKARRILEEAGRRGFVFQEAIALEAQFPGTLEDHFIDVVGCQTVDSQDNLRDTVLCLSLMNGKPESGECSIKRASPDYGAASCLK